MLVVFVGDLDELLFWVGDLIMPKEASPANQSRPDLNTLAKSRKSKMSDYA